MPTLGIRGSASSNGPRLDHFKDTVTRWAEIRARGK